MTVIAVLADPPRPGLVLPKLAATSPLSETEAADLYAAMLRDTFIAVDRSGGDLLVNYRPDDLLPDEFAGDRSSEAELRTLVVDALGDTSDARFEPQVGSTFAARAGNTATHLLRDESARSVAITRGNAPLLMRTVIDSAAMRLRRNEVVLGPSTDGRTYYSGFTAPIDFTDAYDAPEVETLTARATDADLDVDFLAMQSVVEDGADLLTLVPLLEARFEAERLVPTETLTFIKERGLRVVTEGDERRLVRD